MLFVLASELCVQVFLSELSCHEQQRLPKAVIPPHGVNQPEPKTSAIRSEAIPNVRWISWYRSHSAWGDV